MKLAFVFAPYAHKVFSENLRVVDDDFGVFPPINVAWAAAIAENAGHEVIIVDANAEGLTVAQTIERLRQFGPQAVGFYFTTYMFWDTHAWAKSIKAALGVPILGGGINQLLYPRESLSHGVIDYGLSGQGLTALPELLHALETGTTPDIAGVSYWQGDEVVCHPPSGERPDFDRYPFPARHLLPNSRYFSITSQLRNFTVMVTSMGCHQNCTFCAIAPMIHATRSADSVLAEMQECVERHGVREIDIFDPDFPFRRRRTKQICQGILDRNLRFEWSCRACINSLDGELLELMHRSGCRKIYLGIETSEPALLSLMDKNLTVGRVGEVISDCRRVGIRPLGFFMTGVPGETRTSLLSTIRYALSLDLEFAQFSRTIAKPGSKLAQQLTEELGQDYWRDYIAGVEPERRIASPWCELSEDEVELWTKLAYVAFYYRPVFILRALSQVRSLDELGRGVRTAIRMLWYTVIRDA